MTDIARLRDILREWGIPARYGFSENPLESKTAYSCSISIEDDNGVGVRTFEFTRNGNLSKHYAGECRWVEGVENVT